MLVFFKIDENVALKDQERKILANREERERRQGVMQMRLNDFARGITEPKAQKTVSQAGDKGQTQKKSSKKAPAPKKGEKRKLDSAPQVITISEPSKSYFHQQIFL